MAKVYMPGEFRPCPGRHRIDPDAVRGELQRHGPGKRMEFDTEFGMVEGYLAELRERDLDLRFMD